MLVHWGYMKRAKPPVIVLPNVFGRVYSRKWTFLGTFLAIFFVSFTALASIGIAPSEFSFRDVRDVIIPPSTPIEIPSRGVAVAEGEGELPLRIEIPAIGIETTVANPQSTKIADLDRALLAGAVRYPGTGAVGEKGNVLMFGHSSQLPVVHNQAFKAFNDIQHLKVGERIYVYGETKRYVYAVEKVEKANTDTGAVPLGGDGARITLATCNNFGEKTDRFLVTAVLVAIEETTQ